MTLDQIYSTIILPVLCLAQLGAAALVYRIQTRHIGVMDKAMISFRAYEDDLRKQLGDVRTLVSDQKTFLDMVTAGVPTLNTIHDSIRAGQTEILERTTKELDSAKEEIAKSKQQQLDIAGNINTIPAEFNELLTKMIEATSTTQNSVLELSAKVDTKLNPPQRFTKEEWVLLEFNMGHFCAGLFQYAMLDPDNSSLEKRSRLFSNLLDVRSEWVEQFGYKPVKNLYDRLFKEWLDGFEAKNGTVTFTPPAILKQNFEQFKLAKGYA